MKFIAGSPIEQGDCVVLDADGHVHASPRRHDFVTSPALTDARYAVPRPTCRYCGLGPDAERPCPGEPAEVVP